MRFLFVFCDSISWKLFPCVCRVTRQTHCRSHHHKMPTDRIFIKCISTPTSTEITKLAFSNTQHLIDIEGVPLRCHISQMNKMFIFIGPANAGSFAHTSIFRCCCCCLCKMMKMLFVALRAHFTRCVVR